MDDIISRQAAIDAINHICPVDTEYDCTLLDRVDVRCVLSDLPSAQPEINCSEFPNNSDTISRQAAIEALNEEYHGMISDESMKIYKIMEWLEELPSAQPERIKGHWIDAVIPNDSGGLPVIVCDKCNTFFPLQFGDGHNFCPNCGADMRGEKNG